MRLASTRLLLGMICLAVLTSCHDKNTTLVVPVAFQFDQPIYGWVEDRLATQDDSGLKIFAKDGTEIVFENWSRVFSCGGILFGEEQGGAKAHFACNGVHSGVYVSGIDFFDGGAENDFGNTSLVPQLSSNDTDSLGYINKQHIWVIPPEYVLMDTILGYGRETFSEGIAIPCNKDGSNIMLSETGTLNTLCAPNDEPSPVGFQNGLLKMRATNYEWVGLDLEERNYYYYITKENRFLNAGQRFEDAHDFSEQLAAVKQNGKWGYINTDGQVVINFQYNMAGDFHNGKAVVSDKEQSVFYINEFGDPITQPVQGYEFTGEAYGGSIKVKAAGANTHLIDEFGNIITKQAADYFWDEDNKVWCAYLPDKSGHMVVVLPNGENLFSDYYFRFYDTVCIGETNSKDVLYDLTTGDQLLIASNIGAFEEGLASCQDTLGNYGYIGKSGDWVIPPHLKKITLSQNGFAVQENVRMFHGGLAIALYDGNQIMMYNPLVYPDGWVSDEFERATSLGLSNSEQQSEQLSKQQLADLISSFQDLIQHHKVDGVFSESIHFSTPEDYLYGLELSNIITREDVAVIFCRLAQSMGEVTANYCGFYEDQSLLTYPSEVNYIASLGLFDIEGNIFGPHEPVSYREASILFLRFFEALM